MILENQSINTVMKEVNKKGNSSASFLYIFIYFEGMKNGLWEDWISGLSYIRALKDIFKPAASYFQSFFFPFFKKVANYL